jgi:hypothetical protein
MGAGFALSMRDLEIRGAGNLLGSQQSGHIASVGYELYCHLLEDAVRQAQNLPPKLSADVDIDLPVEACLPPEYVADLRHKIDLYRRIGKLDHVDQIRELVEELRDRFGPLPPQAIRMLKLAELRLDAAVWQIASIQCDQRFMILNYGDRRRVELLAKRSPIEVRIVDAKRAYVPTTGFAIDEPSGRAWLDLAKMVLSGHGSPPAGSRANGSSNAGSQVTRTPQSGTGDGKLANSPAGKADAGATRTGVAQPTKPPRGKVAPKPLPTRRPSDARPAGQSPPLAALRRKGSASPPADDSDAGPSAS